MPSSSSKSSKPKPSEVASETKKYYTPLIKHEYANRWQTCSYICRQPLIDIQFEDRPPSVTPPVFYVSTGDPVDMTINWQIQSGTSIPFICAANDRRPGGDWETGAVGYEERLCRRSTLAAALATPGQGSDLNDHYPIPICAGIMSQDVVVFRGPHDKYEKLPLEQWRSLPVVSVPPPRWPKLTQNGTKYSFADEREMVRDKLRGALRICAYYRYDTVVIGDFGLGNGYRNPPQELAELWREVFLYDPDLRGRIRCVMFVFEDPAQSTMQLILDEIAKKAKGGSSSKSKKGGSSSSNSNCPTDFQIFNQVFDSAEIQRVIARPDARYGLDNLLV
ncbi:uncharacterized protein PODANS_5_8790 [Podospora anserina S mat+]|uniref:Podospora anserina S mat+ genomic DNA chromosome 5, supercontig 9 n=3 Tax=Podospora TaxID=5144 RepID=B2AL56_PODAN|nr:uncharacterized protein PODANS_5_8790 [Podospora anserina S mat+]KAK4653650.1 hypothetical protein QC762_508790 [Podospora pseudocomata]KAK4664916.1 hypothetical protein QC763_508790 [Podospora pseudopauciseta]CAP64604.1 unnamed protein product [Podospora anserina S mat+]CDP30002.1 Putative protein of unknown function [Podospora anserina S mat+]